MPGAFAHLTFVNLASGDKFLDSVDLNDSAYNAINEYLSYCEMGAVSPDYPYLAISLFKKHGVWADYMHLDEKTKKLIIVGIKEIKKIDNNFDKEKVFAWLCGFLSHIVADVVLHPVIELKVGPYNGNETDHRICEVNQDSYIYQRMGLGAIGMAEHLKSGVSKCSLPDDDDKIDPLIKKVWEQMLKEIRPNDFISDKPDIDAWHEGFNENVNIIEEGGKLSPLARHVAVNVLGATYPAEDAIDMQFIENLKIPSGELMHYDDIFDKAIEQIVQSWKILGDAVFSEDKEYLTFLGDWNLDSGRDTQDNLVFWA